MARLKQTFPQWRDSARGMTWIHRFSGESYWHLTLTCKAHQPLVLRGGHSLDVEIERQRLESNRFLYPWKHLSNEFSEENNMLFEIRRNILDGYNSPNNHIKVSGNLRWDDSWETPSFHQKLSISWLTNRRSRLRKVKSNPQLLWCQQICFTVLPWVSVMPMFEFPGNEGVENSISAKHQKKTYFHARGTHGTKEFVVEIHVDIWVGGVFGHAFTKMRVPYEKNNLTSPKNAPSSANQRDLTQKPRIRWSS